MFGPTGRTRGDRIDTERAPTPMRSTLFQRAPASLVTPNILIEPTLSICVVGGPGDVPRDALARPLPFAPSPLPRPFPGAQGPANIFSSIEMLFCVVGTVGNARRGALPRPLPFDPIEPCRRPPTVPGPADGGKQLPCTKAMPWPFQMAGERPPRGPRATPFLRPRVGRPASPRRTRRIPLL